MKYGSAFTGIGGFDLALDRAGLECAWQVEKDKWCNQVLRYRWPEVNRYEDINNVGSNELDGVDIITGGFPCQDLSVAGRREGLDGSNSGLFFEFSRIIDEISPRWVLVENVPGLLTSNSGKDFAVLLCELTGYHPEVPEGGWKNGGICDGEKGRALWRVLDSKYFGVPQRRRRVFIVVDTTRRCGPEVLFERSSVQRDSREVREERKIAPTLFGSGAGTSRTASSGSESEFIVADSDEGGIAFDHNRDYACAPVTEPGETLDANYFKGPGNVWGKERQVVPDNPPSIVFNWQNWANNGWAITKERSSPLDKSQTKAVVDGRVFPALRGFGHGWQGQHNDDMARAGLPVTNSIPRRLTPVECARLQGFPDNWNERGVDVDGNEIELSDTQRYKQYGNAITVPVVEHIIERILEHG